MRHFVPGRFTPYPGTNFAPIFSVGKSPGKDVPGHLDRGVYFCQKSSAVVPRIKSDGSLASRTKMSVLKL